MKRKVLMSLILLVFVFSLSAVSTDWFYNTLNNEKKILYNRIGDAVIECRNSVDGVIFDGEECLRIYLGYLDDHPGIFWVENGIQYRTNIKNGDKVNSIVFQYTQQANLKADQTRFINLVSKFSSYLEEDPDDYTKLYHIYDYLASTIEYSTDYPDQSMWSVFFEGIGVCAGFARSFQYLALLEGIPAVIVHGYARNDDGTPSDIGHLWIMAEVDGEWYHFDPTWAFDNGDVDFTYFCLSRERIELTHVIDNNYPIPRGGDDSLSLVRLQGRYLLVYLYNAVKNIVAEALQSIERSVTIEFSCLDELMSAEEDLFKRGNIVTILEELGMRSIESISYRVDEKAYSMKLIFET